jgi:hypothetical protein
MQHRELRKYFRIAMVLFGAGHLIAAAVEGFRDSFPLVIAGMSIFIAATNFCTQCPLLSAVKRIFSWKKSTVVETTKL